MSGYQEALTDPSYHRQILVTTAPHIGNTGWNDHDGESLLGGEVGGGRVRVARQVARRPSRRGANRPPAPALDAEGAAGGADGSAGGGGRAMGGQGAEREGIACGV